MCQCCPAMAPAVLQATADRFPGITEVKGWVLGDRRAVAQHLPGPGTGRYHPQQTHGRAAGSLQSPCAAGLGGKVRISQTRMPKLPCPTSPTVSWINERESLDREVLWVHLVGDEMFSFVSVQVVLLKQAKVSFLTWVTA